MDIDLTYEKLMASIQADREADRVRAEADRVRAEKEWAEMREYLREAGRRMEASSAETYRAMKESAAETDRVVKAVSQQLGGMGNSDGAAAENYFFNSLDKTKMFGNEQFDYADQNVKFGIRDLRDEYDIVLYNGSSIGIVEVKYDAEKKDITQTINKATTFRQLFPAYKDFTFYLGLAGFVFDKGVEKAALDAGLAVIKQVGDTVVVQGERMKKF